MSFKTVVAAVLAAAFIGTAYVSAAQTGDATWYTPNGRQGSCGPKIQNNDLAVALSKDQYAGGSHCNRKIAVHYQGKSVDATVLDLCPGCASGDIDLTTGAFQKLAPQDTGRIQVTWDFE